MSFVEFLQDDPLLTREQVMATIIQVANELDMPDKRGACVIAGMTISQEVGVKDNDPPNLRRFWCPANHADEESFQYPHDSVSNDGRSCGYLQQQKGQDGALWWGTTASEMGLKSALTTFMQRLKKAGYNASNAQAANDSAQRIQQSGVPNAYGQWWSDINGLYDSVIGTPAVPDPVTHPSGMTPPPFIENNVIGDWHGKPYGNSQSRGNDKVRYLVLHTTEGAGGASLLDYMQGAEVSYHYVVDDTGVLSATVWDLVDTDRAAWSVGNGNDYTINYVFGTSRAANDRATWIKTQDDSIKAMAWIVALDAHKYGIDPIVRVGGSASGYASLPGNTGITDHKGINTIVHGDHTDVGPYFPWDVFNTYLQQYYYGIEEDDMFSDDDRKMMQRIYFELTNPWNSDSIYAAPNEKPNPGNTLVGVAIATDAMTYNDECEDQARDGDEDSIMRVIRTAAGKGKHGTDPVAIERATNVLNELQASGVLATYEAAQK